MTTVRRFGLALLVALGLSAGHAAAATGAFAAEPAHPHAASAVPGERVCPIIIIEPKVTDAAGSAHALSTKVKVRAMKSLPA